MRGRGAATNLRLKTLEKQALNGPPLVTFECVSALDVKNLLRHAPRPPTLTYVLLAYVLEMPESYKILEADGLERSGPNKKTRNSSVHQAPLNGAVSNGGVSRSGLVLPFLSFFVLFCPFWGFPNFSGIFPICSGMVQGFSRFVPFLFLGLLRAPTRNSPERVRDTIWTFPEKSGKHPGLEAPRFSFSQVQPRLTAFRRRYRTTSTW